MAGNDLDFSGEALSLGTVPAPQLGPEYDPRPHEDAARRRIAYALIGLLWFIVCGIMLMLYCDSIEVGDLKEFGVLLSPILALVSAATGFYYGTRSVGSNASKTP